MTSHSKATEARPQPGADNGAVPSGAWRVVAERSRVGFRVKKMGLYFVKGAFSGVHGTIDFGPDGASVQADVVIDAATIDTRMPPRDWHLRTKDFLDVRRHPEIRVTADRVELEGDRQVRVPATFEIHGERSPVTLTGHVHGGQDSPSEGPVLHLSGVLDRHDFGVRPRLPVEWVVGRQVELDVELALARRS